MIAKPPRPLFNVSASPKNRMPTIIEVTGSNKHIKLALIIGHRQWHPI